MLQFATPDTLFTRERDTLMTLLPAVRDGSVDAVHDARVSSRRIRELVPLLTSRYPPAEIERLGTVFKDLTRTLGRVRDLDVMLNLLGCIETQVPRLADATAAVHAGLRRRRERMVRKTLKRLERMDVGEVLSSVDGLHPRRFTLRRPKPWRDLLRQQIVERADDVRRAIDHAGGVYFPNRLHGARIALKKLRYSLEISAPTGLFDGRPMLGPLKKAQDLLGRIHDREVLAAFADRRTEAAEALAPILDMQRYELHRRYLGRRERLIAIADALTPKPYLARRAQIRPAVILVAGAVPLALFAFTTQGGTAKGVPSVRGAQGAQGAEDAQDALEALEVQ